MNQNPSVLFSCSKDLVMRYLFLITMIALAIRLFGHASEPLWLDEAFTLHTSIQPWPAVIGLLDNTPPLFNIMLKIWTSLFGTGLSSVRLLPVLIGTSLLPVIYLLAKRLGGQKAGLAAAALAALNPMLVYYSQELRAYSLVFLLSALSYLSYIMLKERCTLSRASLYTLVSALMLYSHMYSILILLSQSIDIIFSSISRERKSRMILLLSVPSILFLPWLLQLPSIISQATFTWIPRPALHMPITLLYDLSSGVLISIPGILLLLGYIYSWSRQRPSKMLLSWISVAIILPFLFALLIYPLFIGKYSFFAVVPFILGAAIPLARRPRMLFLLLVLSIAALVAQHVGTQKDRWDEVSARLQDRGERDIGVLESSEVLPLSYYLMPDCFASQDIYACAREKRVFPLGTVENADELESQEAFIIVSRQLYSRQGPAILQRISERYDIVSEVRYASSENEMKLLMLRRKS